jgi:undecaprenyl-diphosphatase
MVNRRAGALLYVFAALFAVSRVYCGVHYPLDIVAGAMVGVIGAAIAAGIGRVALSPVFEWIIRLGRRLYLA